MRHHCFELDLYFLHLICEIIFWVYLEQFLSLGESRTDAGHVLTELLDRCLSTGQARLLRQSGQLTSDVTECWQHWLSLGNLRLGVLPMDSEDVLRAGQRVTPWQASLTGQRTLAWFNALGSIQPWCSYCSMLVVSECLWCLYMSEWGEWVRWVS